MGRVVLVTGIASSFASQFANRIAESKGIDKVVGIDTILPKGQLEGVKFVRADIRTPVVGKVMAVEEVDTVVHLGVGPPTKGRSSAAKELNVIGTMQLLAACQRAAGVTKFVLGSSTAVYGTSPRDPAMFTESSLARGGVRSGFPKDIVEVESYVRGFARRRPEVIITTLRGAQLLHQDIDTPLRHYFDSPVLPTALGFDPRLQFLHVEDAMNVLVESVVNDRPGTFNVAGDGVVMLSQAARRLGKPLIPLPSFGFAAGARRVLKAMGSDLSPDLHRLLTYGRVVDTTALRDIFGYELKWTSEQAFEDYRATARPGILSSIGGRA
ncbi:NAD-dependent epimerase/dehydratase family protein [Aeromicrobium panaciterrae]|uniref:NAD-dependent epimerase/dehydratase family protein n=1 Tax=Aeromicrobium panaciterrae TaxID=363861 RepID=UPI0031D8D7C3